MWSKDHRAGAVVGDGKFLVLGAGRLVGVTEGDNSKKYCKHCGGG